MTAAALSPATPQRLDLATIAAVGITVVGWASAFPAIRAGLTAFGPIELGAIRFGIAALPALVFLLITRPSLPSLGEVWRFATGGVVFVALYTVLLNMGEQTVSAGAASFIINVSPILTAIFATLLLGERFRALAWVGTFVSFFGVGLIALGEGDGLSLDTGALLIFGGAVCTTVNTIVQKPLFSRHKPLTVAAWNMVIGGLMLSPALPSALSQAVTANSEALLSAIYLGIIPSFVAYGAWAVALSRLPASRASNYLYCVPPVATFIGFVWLAEAPGMLGIVGGLLALGGVVIVNLRR
ncbi:DMT family transporter [Mesorhizobium sp. LHD-90]|uniref:DMT family transporter n=1 Tax=Mesorhizobium sp. LHD-90 TaxID=3071414 RepID=UPI0027DF4008|nr:DMT family transporter [Mesorhizobium sp. LHD-90]MDQ6434069.1 DMT family transporter [Mesorhizobium sp. LHD-90]